MQKVIIDSRLEAIEELEAFLQELSEKAGLSDEQYSQVQLALNEAVTNAILHGNKENIAKKVTVAGIIDNQVLKISVQDEGAGFNPEQIDDPLKKENLLKDSGRGIFLIKQNADRLQFYENGAKLTMQFELEEP